jgi:hypothetical protein
MHLAHTFLTYYPKIHSNITLPFMPRSSKWFSPSGLPTSRQLQKKMVKPILTKWTMTDSRNLKLITNQRDTELQEDNSKYGYEVGIALSLI